MMKDRMIRKVIGSLIVLGILVNMSVPEVCAERNSHYVKNQNVTRIHFISLKGDTDAILLESNGHFGMVDSGEDWDYPNSEQYPLREYMVTDSGYEQQVIHYLRKQGVQKLDFYIATHAHSDHIGSGDEILNHFPTDRLYINQYDDSYMLDAHGKDLTDPYYFEEAQEYRLWDNQYVYDQLIQAAKENGTEIITDLDLEENASGRSFSMGDMTIDIMNYERLRDENGNIIPVASENNNCLVTKVTAFDQVALLTSDIEPLDGDCLRLANQLIEEFKESKRYERVSSEQSEIDDQIGDAVTEPVDRSVDSAQNRSQESNEMTRMMAEEENPVINVDESQVNTGEVIQIELMKMCHHSYDENNPTYFLTSLNPKTVIVTGLSDNYNEREQACLPDSMVYATDTDSAAIISTFHSDGISTNYVKMSAGWESIDGREYYFDENGRTFTEGAYTVNGRNYAFDKKGALQQESLWSYLYSRGVWMYWDKQQFFQFSQWKKDEDKWYYLDENGYMCIGWTQIGDAWYYFDSHGVLQMDQWIGESYVNADGRWLPEYQPEHWVMSGTDWWYRHVNGTYTISGWEEIDQNWYYFDESGWMVTGWRMINGAWYYFDTSGYMVSDCWIGDYYINPDGIWTQDETVGRWVSTGDRWWYQYANGAYSRLEWKEIDSEYYYFDASGWMVVGWREINQNWYYFKPSGVMAHDEWIGNDYVGEDGIWKS